VTPRPAVDGVRSVDLGVTDLRASIKFYTETWSLALVVEHAGSAYLRGTGSHHHVLALHARPRPELLRVDLTTPDKPTVDALHGRLRGAAIQEIEAPAAIAEPGGGYGFTFKDPDGRIVRVFADAARHGDTATAPDRPSKITHIVLNAPDRAAISAFYCEQLGFRRIDSTKMLTFLCCSRDHHTIAFAESDASSLHHIAFEMPDIDSVMRGAGRMRERGFPIEWGVGRHGPGDNVFAYFIGPDDVVIEYTAEVEQVDERYRPRGPDEWVWPPGRTDQWGIAVGPTPRIAQAQKRIRFAPELFRASG
jgi:catechol 2,3-dioxygenase-like lactoylglutathione lyase family enzyme